MLRVWPGAYARTRHAGTHVLNPKPSIPRAHLRPRAHRRCARGMEGLGSALNPPICRLAICPKPSNLQIGHIAARCPKNGGGRGGGGGGRGGRGGRGGGGGGGSEPKSAEDLDKAMAEYVP